MPQSKSWLARGAFILIAYSVLCGLFWLSALLWYTDVSSVLLWPTVIVGVLAAMYTAFLFGQCEGRDLWQTPLLPIHLVVQTLLCGAAVLALLASFDAGISADAFAVEGFAKECLLVTLFLNLLMILGEIAIPHTTDNARYAARLMTRGPFSFIFWVGALVMGTVVPLVFLLLPSEHAVAIVVASSFALLGVLAFDWCFVMAGQSVPNS